MASLPFSSVLAQCEGDCAPPVISDSEGVVSVCAPETGEVTVIADSEPSSGATLSPDGTMIAYRSEAVGVREAIDDQIVNLPSQIPSNIWLWEVGSEESVLIAGQPEEATISADIGFEYMVERSVPVWSPDGTQLAWGEFNLDTWTYQIMVYNLEDETVAVLIEEPPSGFQDVVFYPYPPSWGDGGIVFVQPNFIEGADGSPEVQDAVSIFDPVDGNLIYSAIVTEGEINTITTWQWLNEGMMLALELEDGSWEALDVESGELSKIEAPEMPAEIDLGECQLEESEG